MSPFVNSVLKILYGIIYDPLKLLHYTHPIHPILVHLTIGTISAAFLFDYIGWIFGRDVLHTSARHSIILGSIAFLVAGLTGLADWGHSYRVVSLAHGANMIAFAFGMKFLLFGVLFVIFIGMYIVLRKTGPKSLLRHLFYLLCFLCVVGFGYYGGNVVYG